MTRRMCSWFSVFTITVILSIFFMSSGFVPAWGEEQAVLNGAKDREASAPVPWSQNFIRKMPYLVYTGKNTSMTVLWQTFQTPAKATIQWGTTPSYGKGPVNVHENGSASGKHQFEYTIHNLTPGTKYYYLVTMDTYPFTGSFVTAPRPAQTTLSFYGYGDTQAGYPNGPADGPLAGPVPQNSVLGALNTDMGGNADRQTLLVHMGDYVFAGLNEFMWDLQQFNLDSVNYGSIQSTFAQLPLMGALGNHEGFDAYTAVAETSNYQNTGELFRKYYPYMYPNSRRFYYSFDYGPVHFAVVDTWSYQGASDNQQTIDAVQLNWLKQNLRASRKPWKVLMLHTPIYDCAFPTPLQMQQQLLPIIESTGVQLVLQGHMHYYSHLDVPTSSPPTRNVTYLTLGGGGAHLVDTNCTPSPYLVMAEKINHFARFDVNGNTMAVTVIRPDNSTVETFTITE
jgi:hypothetical protein